MSIHFQVTFRKNNGNLHVSPKGDFDGSSAWELVNLLQEQYEGTGRVFINTKNLRKVCSFGCRTFKCNIHLSRVPVNQLFFKGEKGFEIAPNGSKVIVPFKKLPCRCNGNCSNCRCSENRKPD